jgi:hypothetical protein
VPECGNTLAGFQNDIDKKCTPLASNNPRTDVDIRLV